MRRLALPALLYLGFAFSLWLTMAYVPLHLRELGLEQFQIGALISLFSLFPLCMSLPSGIAADRLLPSNRLATLGLALMSAFALLVQRLRGFPGMLVAFCVGGMGSSLFTVACSSALYKGLGGEERRGRTLGAFFGTGLFGYGLGPLVGGLVAGRWGIRAAFGLAFGILAALTAASLWMERRPPERFPLREYLPEMRRPEFVGLMGATLLFAAHFGVERTCLSLFLRVNLGGSLEAVGLLFFLVGLTLSASAYGVGVLTDRLGALGGLLVGGMCLSAALNLVMPWVRSYREVVPVRLVHVVGDSAFLMGQRVAISRLVSPERVGGALGIVDLVTTAGTFLGAAASGLFREDYAAPFVMAGALQLVAALGYPLVAGRPARTP